MKMGILGLPKAGKTTFFNLLTRSSEATDKYAQSAQTHLGVARVPDRRLVVLRDLYQPKKFTQATVEYVDIPGIRKGEGSESLDLAELKNVDALVHVVRAFEDPEILHTDGSIDPSRDVETINLELILADMEIVERRLERLRRAQKRGLKPEEVREEVLLRERILPALEDERCLREIQLPEEDERRLRGFQLLSAKPILLVINLNEEQLGTATADTLGIQQRAATKAVTMSAPIEAEIAQLPPEEQSEFLNDLGLDQPSIDRAIQASYELLGLISFFTVGEDEVRAWTIRQGTPAREAAGAIHSDIERGFIRAEIVGWEDLLQHKSFAGCRDAGILRLEGKEYVVRDGEVAHFRFNI